MKKSFHILVFWLLLTAPIIVMAQQNTFSKVLHDLDFGIQANSIHSTFDHGYIVAGRSVQSGLIFKMDSACNVVWNKTFFNVLTDYTDIKLNCIIQSNDSSFIAVGDCYNPINYSSNALCIKLNSFGDTLWTKNYIATGSDKTTLLSVQQTNDLGYIMAGYVEGSASPYSRVFVAKIDSSGNLQWANQLDCGNYTNIGYSVKQTSDSGYILSGTFINYPPNDTKSFLIKFAESGNISWSKSFQSNSGIYEMGGFDVIIMPDGFMLYSAGALIKTDFAGNVLWNKIYSRGGYMANADFPSPKLHRTSDDGFIFISTAECLKSYMIKTDSVGNLVWSDYLDIIAVDILQTKDNGFLSIGNGPICGVKKYTTLPQIGVIKMDSSGFAAACYGQNDEDSSFIGTIVSSSCVFSTIAGATENSVHPDVDSIDIESINGCVPNLGAINENEFQNRISIYPNPATGKINLVVSQHYGEIKTIEIYNCVGQLQMKKTDNFSDLEISQFTKGLYFIVVTNNKGETLATKVIKE